MADEHNIELTPDIKVESVLKSAKRLRAAIQSAFDGVEGKQLDSRLQSMQNKMDQVSKKSQEVEKSLESMFGKQAPTTMYDDALRRLEKTSQEIDKLEEKMNRYLETGCKKSSKTYAQMEYDLQKLVEKQDQLSLTMEHLEKAKLDYMPASASKEAQDLVKQQEQLNNQMRVYNEAWNEAIAKQKQAALKQEQNAIKQEQAAAIRQQRQELTGMNKTVTGLTSTIRGVGRLIPGVSTRGVMAISMVTKGVARLSALTKKDLVTAIGVAKAAFSKLFATIAANPIVAIIAAIIAAVVLLAKRIKKLIDESKKQIEELGKALLSLGKKLSNTFANLATSLGKGFLGFYTNSLRGMIKLIELIISKLKALQSTISDGLKQIALLDNGLNPVNKSLSNLTNSLEYVKTALATAFAPILTVVEPAITQLLDMLAEAITYIGMFVAALTGATSFKKAIKQQKDYADSLNKTAGAAKNASGQLASFDKLNVISTNSGSGDSSIGDMFEDIELADVEIPEWLTDLYELGRSVGTSIRDFLNSIPWGKVKEGAEFAAQGVADFLNGLSGINGVGRAVGTSLGEIINTFTTFANTMLTQTYWDQIGKQIGEGITSFIDDVEWDKLGQLLPNFLDSVTRSINGFTTEFDGSQLGDRLSVMLQNALSGIKWTEIQTTMYESIQDLVGILNGLITPENFELIGRTLYQTLKTIFINGLGSLTSKEGGIDFGAWGESIAAGINEIFKTEHFSDFAKAGENISNLATGLLDMLLTAVNDIEWDKVADRLIEFLSNIDWKKISEKAKEISEKLREGLKTVWDALQASGAFDDIIDLIVDVLKEKKNWEKAFKRIKSSVIREVVVEKIKSAISNFWNDIDEALFGNDEGKGIGQKIIEGILEGMLLTSPLGPIITWFETCWNDFCDTFGIHSPSEVMKPIGENIILGILEGFGLVNFAAKLTEWWNTNIKPWFSLNKWTEITNNVKTAVENLRVTLSNKFTAIKNKIVTTFTAIKTGIKKPIQGILDFVYGLVNKIIDGVNSLIEKLNSLSDVKFKDPLSGKEYALGISIPALDKVPIPKLAQGAVIPPNKEFLAMLGDQKSGTNIEAPLETIEQALANVLRTIGINNGGEYHIHVDVDGREIAKAVYNQNNIYKARTQGRSMFT